jgi:hypothetical protein
MRRSWSHGRRGFAKLPRLPFASRRVLTKARKNGVRIGSITCVSLDDSSKAGKNGGSRTIFSSAPLRRLCGGRPSVGRLVRGRETRAQQTETRAERGVAFLNTSGRPNATSFGGEATKIGKIGSSAHAIFVASVYKSVAFLNTFGRRPWDKPRRHRGHGGKRESWEPQPFCVSAFAAISAYSSRNFRRLQRSRAAHRPCSHLAPREAHRLAERDGYQRAHRHRAGTAAGFVGFGLNCQRSPPRRPHGAPRAHQRGAGGYMISLVH